MTTDPNTADISADSAEQRTSRSRLVLVAGALCLPLLALWAFGDWESPEVLVNAQSMQAVSVTSKDVSETSTEPVPLSDETYRQLIVGTWETDRDGHRHLTVSADGTAVMNVEIPGNWSLFFGEKMKFDISWKIEDGVLTFETTGGEPKAKVDLITSMYGKERVQKIKRLDETTMQLPDDKPDGEDHVWMRIEPADSKTL